MVLGAVPGGRGLGTVHLLLAMAAALVAAAAIVAFALAFLNEEAVEQSPQSSQTLVVKAADIEEQPGVPTLSAVHPLEADDLDALLPISIDRIVQNRAQGRVGYVDPGTFVIVANIVAQDGPLANLNHYP